MALVGRLKQNSTKFGQSRFVTGTQLKCHVLTAIGVKKKLLVKFWESMVCVRSKIMFLTLPGEGITPQILTLKFPVHTSGPKQKRK